MKTILRLTIAVMVTAAIMSLIPISSAEAQICADTIIAIYNNTNCTVNLCLVPVGCTTIPPGIVLFKRVPANTNFTGVVSAGGINYPWVANPAAPPPLWVPRITVGPSGCCVNVYYDPATCTIGITTAPVPPACNP